MFTNRQYALLPLFFMLAWLQGCATVAGPYKAAETAEQKAFALYGTFVVFEERGASVINDNRIDIRARQAIQRADSAAKPVADSTLEAALQVNEVRQEIGASENKLKTVTANLENWIMRFEPLVTQLVAAVKGAK